MAGQRRSCDRRKLTRSSISIARKSGRQDTRRPPWNCMAWLQLSRSHQVPHVFATRTPRPLLWDAGACEAVEPEYAVLLRVRLPRPTVDAILQQSSSHRLPRDPSPEFDPEASI